MKREVYLVVFQDGDKIKIGQNFVEAGELIFLQTIIKEIEPRVSINGKPYVNIHIQNTEHKEEKYIITRFDVRKIIYKVI